MYNMLASQFPVRPVDGMPSHCVLTLQREQVPKSLLRRAITISELDSTFMTMFNLNYFLTSNRVPWGWLRLGCINFGHDSARGKHVPNCYFNISSTIFFIF